MLVWHVIFDLSSFIEMIKWTHICMKQNEKKILKIHTEGEHICFC